MVLTRHQSAAVREMLLESAFQHPTLWEFVGKGKYLQMAVSKAIARVYAAKFAAVTAKDLTCASAKDGNLSLMLWARELGCIWDNSVFLKAVENGQIAIMQFLLDNDCPISREKEAFEAAAKGRKLETLEWLSQNKFELDADACREAAGVGWLDGLKYLRGLGCGWDSRTRLYAAMSGNLDLYKYLHHCGCPGSHDNSSMLAERKGRLEILRWMYDDGWRFNINSCMMAAAGGHLEVLQWMRANGAPWDFLTVRVAQTQGHPDVERWAIANGCPEPDAEYIAFADAVEAAEAYYSEEDDE